MIRPPRRALRFDHFGLLALSVLAACGNTSDGDGASSAPAPDRWSAREIAVAPGKLGGCAIGEIDPDHEGNEVVAVCVTGEVFVIRGYRDATRFVMGRIFDAPGELIQCAIGDTDPSAPGNEIVVVGMKEGTEDDGGAGVVIVLSRDGLEWNARTVLEDTALVHACCVTDIDPDQPGDELVAAGFGQKLWVINGDSKEAVATLTGPAKSLYPFDGGVAVACANGELALVKKEAGRWSKRVLQISSTGQARLGGAGDRLLAARDDGKLVLVDAHGNSTEIYGQSAKLRGAVLGDLDPGSPGLEAATAGYESRLTLLTPRAGDDGAGPWQADVVFTDEERFHHVAIGELVSRSPGLEVIACGYSGRVVLAGLAVPSSP